MDFTKRQQIVILILVLLVGGGLGLKLLLSNYLNANASKIELYEAYTAEEEENFEEEILDEKEELIIVHIAGQVYYPGVVQIKSGKRVIDAIEMCGGLKEEADLTRINLAKKLQDEEKVFIPRVGEEIYEDFIQTVSSPDQGSGMININTCNKTELMTLPGIGDKLANNIIEYRETNKFKSIDDIKKVPGIGDKKFESIIDLIIVK